MPKRREGEAGTTWTPNQVVAANLGRLRQRRGLTQAEAARQLSAVAGKEWTEAMVAHAERSVTGNRVREFTADDLVTMARAFDVPVLYFLTPPPTGVFVQVPGSQITTLTMLEAVLGRRRQPGRVGSTARRVELRRRRGTALPSQPGTA